MADASGRYGATNVRYETVNIQYVRERRSTYDRREARTPSARHVRRRWGSRTVTPSAARTGVGSV
ncbi:hypothetical protein ABT218_38855, partial [Streptomyces sp. NPDC001455]|uniref:hypothetical protein n=1 Tax=Streptomyces sp. NPDC001455 TaxID=3154518 RepID=UPI00331C430C